MVLKEVEGQAFRISLELSEQEHEGGNDSVSNKNSNSTAQERFIPATPKRLWLLQLQPT